MYTKFTLILNYIIQVVAQTSIYVSKEVPKAAFYQEWKVKPRRGRQRKPWNKYVDKLFDVLGLPKGELLDDIKKGQCPLRAFFVKCE